MHTKISSKSSTLRRSELAGLRPGLAPMRSFLRTEPRKLAQIVQIDDICGLVRRDAALCVSHSCSRGGIARCRKTRAGSQQCGRSIAAVFVISYVLSVACS
jgi:hypothetical protein